MNKLQRLKQGLSLIETEFETTKQIISNKSRRLNEIINEKRILEHQIREEEKGPQVGDIYIYNGVTTKFKLMVAQVGEPKSPLYCLVCLDSYDKGKRWDEPTPDINKVWGLQKANEFTKVEQ